MAFYPTLFYATKFPGVKESLTKKRVRLLNMHTDNTFQTFPFSVK